MDGRHGPYARCAQAYVELRQRLAQDGLDAAQIAGSGPHSDMARCPVILRPHACEPTGVALGSPLPGDHGEVLSQLAVDFVRLVAGVSSGPTFAFVPRDKLHVTVVNRTHFEEGTGHIDDLRVDEHAIVADVVRATVRRPIIIELRGLLLTTGGRLLVPGYPADDALFQLRARLVDRLPQLGLHLPATAHLKLGHLLALPAPGGMRQVTRWLAKADADVAVTVAFTDLYTPVARIGIGP